MPTNDAAVHAAAQRLIEATAIGRACPPVRDLIGRDDLAAAYAVQSEVTRHRLASGATVVGRKIGLTSPAVQAQIGVDQPDFGVLFDDMAYPNGGTISFGRVLQPRIEAEVAFVLANDLAEGPLDAAQVRGAIDHAVAALEICGSRVAGWDISLGDTVADNASSGVFVLGGPPRTLDEVEPRDVVMEMTFDGEVVSTGNGAACLGDPVEAVVWLARAARSFGEPLRAGQVILSGALGPMRAVTPGLTVSTTVTRLGTATVTFTE
jgi:2-keto-4-pentenoate hydratase